MTIVATVAGACSDEAPPVVAMVQVDPEVASVEVGETLPLQATAFDEKGHRISGRAVTWASADPSIATVDGAGVAGVSVGDTEVTATIDGKTGAARVQVIPATVATVDVGPAGARIFPDETVQLTAAALSSRGAPIEGRALSWTAADPEIATVDAAGLVRGRKPGAGEIVASIDGVQGTVTVSVIPRVSVIRLEPARLVLLEGGTGSLVATVIGTNGDTLVDRDLEWTTGDSMIAAAGEGGVIQALRPGVAAVYAEAEGVIGMAMVEVRARPASLRIEPPALVLQVDTTWGLGAIVTDTAGGEHSAEGCVWSSTAPDVIRIHDDGSVRTLAAGAGEIGVSCEGLQASMEAKVLQRAQVRILGPGKVPMGGSIRLDATMSGRPPQGPVRWSVSPPHPYDGALATVGSDGAGGATLEAVEYAPEKGPLPGIVWALAQAEGRAGSRAIVAVPRFVGLQAAPYHTCGVTDRGEFFCWGHNRLIDPQGDRADPVPWPHPVLPRGASDSLAWIAPGETRGFGLAIPRGNLVGWGCDSGCDDGHGSRLHGEADLSEGPAFAAISAGYGVRRGGVLRAGPSCGLVTGGRIHCWNLASSPAPFDPAAFVQAGTRSQAATEQIFTKVAVGVAFVCALTTDGEPWCWGSGGIDAENGRSFEAGAGSALPAPLAGAPRLVSLSAGKYHACGLTSTGAAWCWGHSRQGALGAGFDGSSEAPVQVAGGIAFREISASIEHTCGLAIDGRVHCWGGGRSVPVPAPVEGTFDTVAAGADHACALLVDEGMPICWGDNSLFQLGVIDDGAFR